MYIINNIMWTIDNFRYTRKKRPFERFRLFNNNVVTTVALLFYRVIKRYELGAHKDLGLLYAFDYVNRQTRKFVRYSVR